MSGVGKGGSAAPRGAPSGGGAAPRAPGPGSAAPRPAAQGVGPAQAGTVIPAKVVGVGAPGAPPVTLAARPAGAGGPAGMPSHATGPPGGPQQLQQGGGGSPMMYPVGLPAGAPSQSQIASMQALTPAMYGMGPMGGYNMPAMMMQQFGPRPQGFQGGPPAFIPAVGAMAGAGAGVMRFPGQQGAMYTGGTNLVPTEARPLQPTPAVSGAALAALTDASPAGGAAPIAAPAREMNEAEMGFKAIVAKKLAAKKKREEEEAALNPPPVPAPAPAPAPVPAPVVAAPAPVVAAPAPVVAAPAPVVARAPAPAPAPVQPVQVQASFARVAAAHAPSAPVIRTTVVAAPVPAPRPHPSMAAAVAPPAPPAGHTMPSAIVASAVVAEEGLDEDELEVSGTVGSSGGAGAGMQRGDSAAVERRAMLLKLKEEYERAHGPKRVLTVKELFRIRQLIRSELTAKGVWPSEMKRHVLLTNERASSRVSTGDESPIAKAVKFLKSVLNKLTRENFTKLSLDLIRYDVKSQEMLETIIAVVFDKALEDVKYQDLFADLCKLLGEKAEEWSKKYLRVKHLSGKEAPAGDGWYYDVSGAEAGQEEWAGPAETELDAVKKGTHVTNFKRLLLNRCQQEFSKASPQIALQESEDKDAEVLASIKAEGREPTEAEQKEFQNRIRERALTSKKAKQRMLSNVSFIGHLYHAGGQLSVPIMHYCMAKLLGLDQVSKDRDPSKAALDPDFSVGEPDDEGVEALTRLLMLVGSKYEKEDKIFAERAAANEKAGPMHREPMLPKIMGWLAQLRRNPALESRLRFRCQDTIDLQARNWKLEGAAADIDRMAKTLTLAQAKAAILLEEQTLKASLMGHGPGGSSASRDYESRTLGQSARMGVRQGGQGGQGGAQDFRQVPSGPSGPRGPMAGPRANASGLGKTRAPASPSSTEGWQEVAPRAGAKAPEPAAAPAAPAGAAAAVAAPAAVVHVYTGDELAKRARGVLREWIGKSGKESDALESIRLLRASPGYGVALVTEALVGLIAEVAFRTGAGPALVTLAQPPAALAEALGGEGPVITAADVLAGVAARVHAGFSSLDIPKMGGFVATILASLVSSGVVTLGDLLPAMLPAATGLHPSNAGGAVLALTAAAVLASAEASTGRAATLATLTAPAGSLRPSSLLRAVGPGPPGMHRLKFIKATLDSVKEAGVKGGADYAIADAVLTTLKDAMALLGAEGAEAAGVTIAARVEALSPALVAAPTFSRVLTAELASLVLTRSSEKEGAGLAAEAAALIGPSLAITLPAALTAHGSAIAALSGSISPAAALGGFVLSGLQGALGSEDVDVATEAGTLFVSLREAVGAEAVQAWLQGASWFAEPLKREEIAAAVAKALNA